MFFVIMGIFRLLKVRKPLWVFIAAVVLLVTDLLARIWLGSNFKG